MRAQLIIQKLARDYAGRIALIPYFWETEPLRATGHFQDEIELPSTHDIVVLILWARLGTSLPPRTTVRAYQGSDGRTPVTGTEWEFEEAVASFRARRAPDLLVYRREGDPGLSLTNLELRREQESQWKALEAFWQRHFENRGEFQAASGCYDTLDAFDRKFEADLVALIERHIRAQVGLSGADIPLHLRGAPYRGMSAYDFADAPVFFGRDAAIRTGLTRLMAAADRGVAFLLVLGASGAGKSSLARAGLLPALLSAKAVPGVGLWRRVVMRPGDAGQDPILALAKALVAGNTQANEGLPEVAGAAGDVVGLARHLRAAAADPSFPFRVALTALADAERTRRALLAHEDARLVLLVDQLEELLTQPGISEADRTTFARVLAGLSRSGVVWVIATVRSDLWHRAADIPDLLKCVEDGCRLDLPAPDGAQLLEMVRKPARAAALAFEEDIAGGVHLDAVLAEAAAAEPGALPLLSVMLEDLYQRDIAANPGHNLLTFASYRALGELRGAIAMRAEKVYQRIAAADAAMAAAFPDLLRALVTTDAASLVTARPAPIASFAEGTPARALIDALSAPDARLLTVEDQDGQVIARLAHEALIAHWPRAARQVETDQRDLETRARLETMLRRYRHASGPDQRNALLSGLMLEEGLDFVRRWQVPATDPLASFVRESARRRALRRRRDTGIAAALVFVFALIALVAGLQWREARQQRATAQANQVQAEQQSARAREAADLAKAETRTADERASQLAARVASSLADEGSFDAALLVLLRAAQVFSDENAPDDLRITLTRVLEKAARTTRVPLGPKVTAFDLPTGLLLYDGESGNLSAYGQSRPLYKGAPGDAAIADIVQITGSDKLLIARTSSEIDVFDQKSGDMRRLGSLPEPSGPKWYSRLTLSHAGVAVRASDLKTGFNGHAEVGHVIDALTGLEADQTTDLITLHAGRSAEGAPFLTDGRKFDEIADHALLPRDLDDAGRQQVLYGECMNGLGPEGQKVILKWLIDTIDTAGPASEYGCDVRGGIVLATVLAPTTGGVDRQDELVGSKGKGVSVRDAMATLSETKLAAANLTWVGWYPRTRSYAAISNRNLLVQDRADGPTGFRHPYGLVFYHRTRPTVAHFMDDSTIAAFEPDEHQLVLHDMSEPARRTVPGENLGPSVDMTTLHALDISSCNIGGGNLPGHVEMALSDGTLVTFVQGSDIAFEDQQERRLSVGMGEDACTAVSRDGSRLLRMGSDEVDLYDLRALLRKGTPAPAAIASLKIDHVMSAEFVGSDKIVVTDGSNKVVEWQMKTDGGWSSRDIYLGDNPVEFAEASQTGDKLLIAEDTGSSDRRVLVYSVAAQRVWFDAGLFYKFYAARFQADGSAAVADHGHWAAVYSAVPLGALTDAANAALSADCHPGVAGRYPTSPCWPKDLQ